MTNHTDEREALPLTYIDGLAKTYSSQYASPHHFVMSCDGLREVIRSALAQQAPAQPVAWRWAAVARSRAHGIVVQSSRLVYSQRDADLIVAQWRSQNWNEELFSLESIPVYTAPPAQAQQAKTPKQDRQYFYKVNHCQAAHASNPECICWHDIGTGPLAGREATATSWRDKPIEPMSDLSITGEAQQAAGVPDVEQLAAEACEREGYQGANSRVFCKAYAQGYRAAPTAPAHVPEDVRRDAELYRALRDTNDFPLQVVDGEGDLYCGPSLDTAVRAAMAATQAGGGA